MLFAQSVEQVFPPRTKAGEELKISILGFASIKEME